MKHQNLVLALAAILAMAHPAIPRADAHPASGIVVDAAGRVYFVDFTGDRILRADENGRITTFADGRTGARFSVPHHLKIDGAGNIHTASDRGGVVVRFDPHGVATQIYPPTDWCGFECVGGGGDPFAVDPQGNVICLNSRQNDFSQILRLSPRGKIEVLVSSAEGFIDGPAGTARIGHLHDSAFLCDANGAVFFTQGPAIRCVRPDGSVVTVLGDPEPGVHDGKGRAARFGWCQGLADDPRGKFVVADYGNHAVRLVDRDDEVKTLSPRWELLKADPERGISSEDAAQKMGDFLPLGVAVGPSGAVFVLDYAGQNEERPRVSRIERDGRASVVCIARPRDKRP